MSYITQGQGPGRLYIPSAYLSNLKFIDCNPRGQPLAAITPSLTPSLTPFLAAHGHLMKFLPCTSSYATLALALFTTELKKRTA